MPILRMWPTRSVRFARWAQSIDRLRTGSPDHLLKDPLLKEILGAGWQTVTYRQNTELMVEAWHWNPAGKWSNAEKQEGYFVGSAEPGAEDSSLLGVSAAASRLQSRRWQRLVPTHRRRSEVVLEEQSVSDQGLHRRRRLAASAVGDDRSGQRRSTSMRSALRGPNPTRSTTRFSSGRASWSPSTTARPRARGKHFRWGTLPKARAARSR